MVLEGKNQGRQERGWGGFCTSEHHIHGGKDENGRNSKHKGDFLAEVNGCRPAKENDKTHCSEVLRARKLWFCGLYSCFPWSEICVSIKPTICLWQNVDVGKTLMLTLTWTPLKSDLSNFARKWAVFSSNQLQSSFRVLELMWRFQWCHYRWMFRIPQEVLKVLRSVFVQHWCCNASRLILLCSQTEVTV